MNSRSNSKNRVDSKTGLPELLKLFSYISPYKKKFYLAFCCLFITASLALAFPYLMGSLLGGAMSAELVAVVMHDKDGSINEYRYSEVMQES